MPAGLRKSWQGRVLAKHCTSTVNKKTVRVVAIHFNDVTGWAKFKLLLKNCGKVFIFMCLFLFDISHMEFAVKIITGG